MRFHKADIPYGVKEGFGFFLRVKNKYFIVAPSI